MNMCDLHGFADGAFDFVVEKAALDTVFCGCRGIEHATTAILEVNRVLSDGGHFVSLSCAPEACRMPYLQDTRCDWSVEHTLVPISSASAAPVHAYVCKKHAAPA